MKPIATLLAVFVLSTFSLFAIADDTVKRSPELAVLDRFVGTWTSEKRVETPDGQITKRAGVETRKWSPGGGFLVFEGAGEPEFHMLLTYNEEAKAYTGVFMFGTRRALVTGMWNEKTKTMRLRGTYDNGNTYESTGRFLDNENAEVSATIKNPDGKILLKLSWKSSRRKN